VAHRLRQRREDLGLSDEFAGFGVEAYAKDVGGPDNEELIPHELDSVRQVQIIEQHSLAISSTVAVRVASK
jgi:hypothetical protein